MKHNGQRYDFVCSSNPQKIWSVVETLNNRAMVDKTIKIPKWQFDTITNALRLTHRINNCSTKETAFDREVVKAYDYAKSALAEPSSVPQANELLPLVSGSALLSIKPNDPMPWEDGEWDGLRSDIVAVLTDRDEWHIGRRYSGYMDGSDFDDWYTPDDYEIQGKVVGWVKLPR